MSIIQRVKDLFHNLGAKSPSGPAPSVFGPDADKRQDDQQREDDWEIQVAKEKGRPKGF